MVSKSDRFYFENLTAAADISYKAANYLVECLNDYDSDNIRSMLDTMHNYEHMGDIKKHEMSSALAKAFVTPVDREDLELISQNIDEVTDSIEEILQHFYIDQIKAVTKSAVEFAKMLVKCCITMRDILAEFVHFKKPQKLHSLIVDLNKCEEECDGLYLRATLQTREMFDDALDVLFWREIYNKMESCADACEHVGDCIGLVVMKNT